MKARYTVKEVLKETELTSSKNHRLQQKKCRGVGFPCLTRSPRTPFSYFFCEGEKWRRELTCVERSGALENGEAVVGLSQVGVGLIVYLVSFISILIYFGPQSIL